MAPHIAPINSVDNGYEKSIKAFLASFFPSRHNIDVSGISLTDTDLIALDHLVTCVDQLMDAYYREKMVDFHGVFLSQAQAPLSVTERARLQRAFFHYELYARCFPLDPHHVVEKSVVHPREQAEWFVARLSSWEVEELSCVYWFFIDRLDSLIGELEEEMLQVAMDAQSDRNKRAARLSAVGHASSLPRIPSKLGDAEASRKSGTKVPRTDPLVAFNTWEEGFFVYRTPGKEDAFEYLASLATLGITFVSQIIFGDRSKSKDLIRARKAENRAFLPEAIDCLVEKQRLAPVSLPAQTVHAQHAPAKSNDTTRPNEGYLMAAAKWKQRTYFELLSAKPARSLQRLGYVYWDAERLKHQDVQARISKALEQSSEHDRTTIGCGQASVEQRLSDRGCDRLPESAMSRIKREYGNIKAPFDFIRFRGDSEGPDYGKMMKMK